MRPIRCIVVSTFLTVTAGVASAQDPLAANNGLLPSASEWTGTFRIANLDYPTVAVASGWAAGADGGPITIDNAEAYVQRVKAFLEPSLRGMIDDSDNWKPKDHGWYDLVWRGGADMLSDGSVDPTSGRDILLDSYTGQILPSTTFGLAHQPAPEVKHIQNSVPHRQAKPRGRVL